MKTGKKYIHSIVSLFMVLFMILNIGKTVLASETMESTVSDFPQSIKETESGIVKLLVYAVDQNGNEYNVKQGTGILIGIDDGEKMILTNDKLVQVEEDLLNNVRRQFGLSTEDSLDIEIDILLPVGTRIKTEIGNKGTDFVILNLENDINDVSCLKLGNSSAVKENDKLYILGYGGKTDILGQTEISNFNLQGNAALVISVTEQEILTDYQLKDEKMGTPVLNAEGYVVGILAIRDSEIYIKPIDRIKDVLDVLDISYQGIEINNHYNEVTDSIRDELNKTLLECENLAMQQDEYTKKSIEKLKSIITEAISVTTNGESTYDDYQNAIEQLNQYKKKLRKKEYPVQMLQIGMGIAILTFVLLGMHTKTQIKKLKEGSSISSGEKAEDGTVIYAKLIRLDTMQVIPVSNVIFRIGQNIGGIDYAVEDNTSVSRHHADIMRKGNEFFILDNNSTNHTFVNEKQIMPGEYVPIKGGDIIRLSDVNFQFEV